MPDKIWMSRCRIWFGVIKESLRRRLNGPGKIWMGRFKNWFKVIDAYIQRRVCAPGKITQSHLLQELDDPESTIRHSAIRPGIWLSALCVIAFFLWACWAEIDETTRGQGRVVPHSRLQKIQSLEGGILEEILVAEGDIVEPGQVLLHLENTRFYTAYKETESKVKSLQASVARLEAEVQGQDTVTFPNSVGADSPEAIAEKALFKARRDKKNEAVASLQEELEITQQQLELIMPLVEEHAVSEIEALRLRQAISNLKGHMAEINNVYLQDAYTELTVKKAELSVLEQSLLQNKDQLRRTKLISPLKGMVNNILVTTRGGVIKSGEAIMEILPIEDQLLIEARVKPKDVAFLAPGMSAKVKITAYDYTIYGELAGTLQQISADTIEEHTARGKEYYYQILVRTEKNYLEHNNQTLPIRPGMIAEVDVLGNKRTVMSYLLKPLIKAKLY